MTKHQHAQHVDTILHTLGATGKYQMIQMCISLIPTFVAAAQLLGNAFIAMNVNHQCAAPSNSSELTSRFPSYDNVTYGECNIYLWSNGSVVAEEDCVFGFQYEDDVSASAISEFDLVCNRKYLGKLSQTLVIAGQGIGAVLTTIVSDRLGRRIVLIAANAGLLLAGLGIAFAPSYSFFAVFKFVAGGFQQGVLTGTSAYNAELFPTSHRHLNAVSGRMSWAISTVVLALVSWLCKDLTWRQTAAIYCCFNITIIVQIVYLDESIRWLLANGKTSKAIDIISKAGRINKVKEDDLTIAIKGIQMEESEEKVVDASKDAKEDEATRKLSLLDILRIRRMLVNALAIWFAWFTTAIGYFSIFLNATSLAGDPYANFLFTSLAEFPCVIYFFYVLNRIGRKVATAIPFLVLALGILVQGTFQTLESNSAYDVIILVASLVGMIGASTCFGAVFSYTPELFPTNVRNQALGLSSFMGRIGGMLAPFTEVLSDEVKWGPGVLIGGCAIVVCLLLTLLPETNGRELPQTIEDLQKWYVKDDGNGPNNESKVSEQVKKKENAF